jgi:hypothetical protein
MVDIAPQIDIELNPVFFVFSWKVHKRKVATLVSLDTRTRDLVAIGEKGNGEDVVSVSLFEPCEDLPAEVDKAELLQTFLEFNIAKLLEKQKILVARPKIVFHEDQQLKQLLCGYQRALLKTAALAAGAREVVFA